MFSICLNFLTIFILPIKLTKISGGNVSLYLPNCLYYMILDYVFNFNNLLYYMIFNSTIYNVVMSYGKLQKYARLPIFFVFNFIKGALKIMHRH